MKPIASLSLDLDNEWSYLKTHGDPGWETLPSYLDIVIPRVLDILARRKLRITFFVVGLRWMGNSKLAAGRDTVTEQFARWTLLHLFLITCMPFATMMIGRYDNYALAVWIYAAVMALGALVSIRLNLIAKHEGWRTEGLDEGTRALWLLIASAALSVAISFYDPRQAMLAYLINFVRPLLSRRG